MQTLPPPFTNNVFCENSVDMITNKTMKKLDNITNTPMQNKNGGNMF